MKPASLQIRFLIPVCLSIFAMVVGGSLVFSLVEQQQIKTQLDHESSQQRQAVLDTLSVIDNLVTEQARGSMKVLMAQAATLGSPQLHQDSVLVGDRHVNQLFLGNTPKANNFELVDSVVEMVGGTATLFVKSGEDYVRISTNVISNGKRAIGTILAPTGRAIAAIRNGEAYYGMVDILGNPFITGYEPMLNEDGETIGIWYVGYRLNMQVLIEFIAQSRLLDSGFMALLDAGGTLRFHSEHISEEAVVAALSTPHGWTLANETFEPWGFQVITAILDSEANAIVWSRMATIIISGVIGASLLIILMVTLMKRLVLVPLGGEPALLIDIAERQAKGYLDQNSLPMTGVAGAIQEVGIKLKETIGIAQQSAQSVSNISDLLSSASEQLATGMENQSERISTIVTASTEMAKTSGGIAQNVNIVQQKSADVLELAKAGGKKIVHSTHSMADILKQVTTASEQASSLELKAIQVQEVVSIITSIAEQTNLLALNAAIEAARAGEAGRGFAVVADEVRSLAERSTKSTHEINTIIASMQEGVGQVVGTMDKVSTSAKDGNEISQDAAESFTQIITAMQSLQENVAVNAVSVEEMSSTAENITAEIQSISEVSIQSLSIAKHIAESAGSLEKNMDSLTSSVTYFKL